MHAIERECSVSLSASITRNRAHVQATYLRIPFKNKERDAKVREIYIGTYIYRDPTYSQLEARIIQVIDNSFIMSGIICYAS